MAATPEKRYTLEEYLELDNNTDERFEFWDGEIFSISGVSANHAVIEINLIVALHAKLSGRKCTIFPANMRIKVPSLPPYRYGDLSALCGEPQYEKIGGLDTLLNPSLIIEVLSASTEAHDRGEKFSHYQSIASFSEYLLIAQHRPHIVHLTKQADQLWTHREFSDRSAVLHLNSLDCQLGLSEVYENVSFEASANESPQPEDGR